MQRILLMVMAGSAGRIHGHSYKVHIAAKSYTLNPSKYLESADMVCDFRELKWVSKDIENSGFDHTVLNEKMDIETTAGRIAEYIHKEAKLRIPYGIDLTVTVWETDTCWVEYTDKDV